jgi:hypothetical protein
MASTPLVPHTVPLRAITISTLNLIRTLFKVKESLGSIQQPFSVRAINLEFLHRKRFAGALISRRFFFYALLPITNGWGSPRAVGCYRVAR